MAITSANTAVAMGATDGCNRSITVSGDGGIVARSTGSGATWVIALNGVSVENLRDVLFLTSGIALAGRQRDYR